MSRSAARKHLRTKSHLGTIPCTNLSLAFFTAVILTIYAASVSAIPQNDAQPPAAIALPAGTKIQLALTSPVWTASAKSADQITAITSFPVTLDNQMAIPVGTFAQGRIDVLIRPTGRSRGAEFLMHFTKLVFADGYTVDVPGEVASATTYVQVSRLSNILMAASSQFEIILQSSLSLDANRVANSVRSATPAQLAPFSSTPTCVSTVGSDGTPTTVIPGSPGIPPTPDTVIPGGPGMPDTVIPGFAGVPPSPPTVIPGMPATSGSTTCFGPPIVSTVPTAQFGHTGSLKTKTSMKIMGQIVPAGTYRVNWTGLGPMLFVNLGGKEKDVAHIPARLVALEKPSPASRVAFDTNSDGSVSLTSVQFKGKQYELRFD